MNEENSGTHDGNEELGGDLSREGKGVAEGRHRARGGNRSLSLDEGCVTKEWRLESQPGDLKRSHPRG